MLPDKGKAKEKVYPSPLHTDRPACFLLPSSLYKEQEQYPPLLLFFPVSKSLIKPYPCTNPGNPSLITTTEQGREKRWKSTQREPDVTRSVGGFIHWNISEHKGLLRFLRFHQGTRALCPSHPTRQFYFPQHLTYT